VAAPGVGDPAPDFELPGTGGRSYRLSSYRGHPVLLVFYPGDNTPVCTEQLGEYTTDVAQFEGLGATVLAISPQSVESHEEFTGEFQFAFPLLADEDKKVGELYGVLGPIGFYRRSVFVVDADGVIRYARRSRTNATYRPTDELVKAIKGTL
jgi:peroxiredoxin Q/BCP